MKKYLMSGIAAFAFCAALTSCSNKEDLYDQGAIEQQKELAEREAYSTAFEKAFGKVGANVDWGFGLRANTRAHANGAIDVNGNEWTSCPAVDDPREVNAIYDYVKYTLPEMDRRGHHYSTTAPENIYGYYVTQVRNGKNDDNVYDSFTGNHIEDCGAYMNYLQIKFNKNATMADLSNATEGTGWKATGWEHINNFNASDNYNHSADTSPLHGNTKVVDQGAFDFAYYNSIDSKFHNNWILVDGYYITDDHKYQDFYYVCFDFEGTPQCTSVFRFYYNGEERGGVEVEGAWTAEEAVKQNLEVTLWNGTKVKMGEDIDTSFKSGQDGVYQGLQVESVRNGDKKFDPDDIHTDWIIRITKGNPYYRVIAEDLNAREDTDFDFNDVVFDIIPNGTTSADIRLIAAGGIYKLTVNGIEVHEAWGEQPDANGLYPMINTGDGPNHAPITLCTLQGDYTGNDVRLKIKNIEIKVYKPGFEDEGLVLDATTGRAACKILVDTRFGVVPERQDISNEYDLFTSYVQGYFEDEFWWRRGTAPQTGN